MSITFYIVKRLRTDFMFRHRWADTIRPSAGGEPYEKVLPNIDNLAPIPVGWYDSRAVYAARPVSNPPLAIGWGAEFVWRQHGQTRNLTMKIRSIRLGEWSRREALALQQRWRACGRPDGTGADSEHWIGKHRHDGAGPEKFRLGALTSPLAAPRRQRLALELVTESGGKTVIEQLCFRVAGFDKKPVASKNREA
jgi:hypothetical protein